MRLHTLRPASGSRRGRKRVGRGAGSGHGQTSGRGDKGQKARSGPRLRPWFEGGQMPLTRRLPKRGFTNAFRSTYACVNVGTLEARFEGGSAVTPQTLLERGLIAALRDGVKVLGEGTLTKALTVQAHRFSRSAAEKIAAAGGTAVVIGA